VRLGDFVNADTANVKRGTGDGFRIPLDWYAAVIGRVSKIFPEMPVRIFTDGREHELADLLRIPGVALQREPNDISDLLALSQARLIIGSNSTFSRWAAFLGNMPGIWFKTNRVPERPNDKQNVYVDQNEMDAIIPSLIC
jgi:hypothetical protein